VDFAVGPLFLDHVKDLIRSEFKEHPHVTDISIVHLVMAGEYYQYEKERRENEIVGFQKIVSHMKTKLIFNHPSSHVFSKLYNNPWFSRISKDDFVKRLVEGTRHRRLALALNFFRKNIAFGNLEFFKETHSIIRRHPMKNDRALFTLDGLLASSNGCSEVQQVRIAEKIIEQDICTALEVRPAILTEFSLSSCATEYRGLNGTLSLLSSLLHECEPLFGNQIYVSRNFMRTLSDQQSQIENLIDNYRKLPFLIIVKLCTEASELKIYLISNDDFALDMKDSRSWHGGGLKRMNELGIHLVSINGSLLCPYNVVNESDRKHMSAYVNSFHRSLNRVLDASGHPLVDEYLGLLGVVMLFSRDFQMLASHHEVSSRLLDRILKNPLAFTEYLGRYRPLWSAQNHEDFNNSVFSKISRCIEAKEDLAQVIDKCRIEIMDHDPLSMKHLGADDIRKNFEAFKTLFLPVNAPIFWAQGEDFEESDIYADSDPDDEILVGNTDVDSVSKDEMIAGSSHSWIGNASCVPLQALMKHFWEANKGLRKLFRKENKPVFSNVKSVRKSSVKTNLSCRKTPRISTDILKYFTVEDLMASVLFVATLVLMGNLVTLSI
jgi:hypothetical protein